MAEPVRQLKTDNADGGAEYEFWTELREICLLPEQAAFNQSGMSFYNNKNEGVENWRYINQ